MTEHACGTALVVGEEAADIGWRTHGGADGGLGRP